MRIRQRSTQHPFESALDEARDGDLARRDSRSGLPAGAAMIMPALEQLSEADDDAAPAETLAPAAAYRSELADVEPRPSRAEAVEPPAEDLTVRPGLAVSELKRLRRRIALASHPDRVPAERREDAARAMAKANAEIDKALREARRK